MYAKSIYWANFSLSFWKIRWISSIHFRGSIVFNDEREREIGVHRQIDREGDRERERKIRKSEYIDIVLQIFETGSYLLYSEVAVSSTWAWVFCRRKRGIPPLFLGATLGHIAGCTRLMQSVWAFALQPRHLTPWRLWPRNTWPQASQGVIFRYVYSRQECPPSDSKLFLVRWMVLFIFFLFLVSLFFLRLIFLWR